MQLPDNPETLHVTDELPIANGPVADGDGDLLAPQLSVAVALPKPGEAVQDELDADAETSLGQLTVAEDAVQGGGVPPPTDTPPDEPITTVPELRPASDHFALGLLA